VNKRPIQSVLDMVQHDTWDLLQASEWEMLPHPPHSFVSLCKKATEGMQV
jgi:hypothetical protein